MGFNCGSNNTSIDGIPPKGKTGQALTKRSNQDYDIKWSDGIPGPPGPTGPNPYPINSLYLATVATNPATTLGFGTWVLVKTGNLFPTIPQFTCWLWKRTA